MVGFAHSTSNGNKSGFPVAKLDPVIELWDVMGMEKEQG